MAARGNSRSVRVFSNPDELAAQAAELIVLAAREALARRGRFTLVLAGGSTPERTYRSLVRRSAGEHGLPDADSTGGIDWSRTFVLWGDERLVPPDDPRSNFRMARQALLEPAGIPASNVLRISTDGTAEQCAARYDGLLRELTGKMPVPQSGCEKGFSHQQPVPQDAGTGTSSLAPGEGKFQLSELMQAPRLDLILLGLGEDGHTASLFPGAAALDVLDMWATWSPPGRLPPPVDRVTLTYPVLNAARQVLFLVSGEAKAPAVRDVLEGMDGRPADRHERPAAGICPREGHVAWLLDEAAARLLTRKTEAGG